MKMGKNFTKILLALLLILTFNNKVYASFSKEIREVAIDKTWKVELNIPLNSNSINENTVYILDSNYNKVEINVTLENNSKTIVIKPKNLYTPNENYTVIIDGILSTTNKKLVEKFEFYFKTNTVQVVSKDKETKSYKLFNDVLRINDKTLVTINYNYELATIASAVATKFNHQAYLTPRIPIRNKAFKHFEDYTELESAKKIYEYSIPEEVMKLKLLYSTRPFLTSVSTFENSIIIKDNSFPRSKESSINSIEELNTLMDNFCDETNARLFFEENYDYYESIFNTFKNNYSFDFIERLSSFFGYGNNEQFIIYLTAIRGGGRSSHLYDENGRRHNLNIININDGNTESCLNTIYHEAAHNFVSLAKDSNRSELEKYEKIINSVLSSNEQLYENKFDETITRAIVVLMLEEYHGEDVALRNLSLQLRNGWKNTDKLYYFIKNNYVENRDDYDTFNEFFPELLKYLEELS